MKIGKENAMNNPIDELLYPDAIHMRDWKYPISNVSECGGRGHVKRATAIVSDADGRKLIIFPGVPHRSNTEAIVMASEFCDIMNKMHEEKAKDEKEV